MKKRSWREDEGIPRVVVRSATLIITVWVVLVLLLLNGLAESLGR